MNLVASDTAPAITCLVPTDKYLKCIGESHIFLGSAEQEPFTPKELGSVDIDCKDSMDISDGINTENRGVASMVIKEKQNASQEDAESEISEVGIDCKEEKTPNQEAKYLSLNNNENPCEVSVTPSGIIQLPEGWMFFDMTPGCYFFSSLSLILFSLSHCSPSCTLLASIPLFVLHSFLIAFLVVSSFLFFSSLLLCLLRTYLPTYRHTYRSRAFSLNPKGTTDKEQGGHVGAPNNRRLSVFYY